MRVESLENWWTGTWAFAVTFMRAAEFWEQLKLVTGLKLVDRETRKHLDDYAEQVSQKTKYRGLKYKNNFWSFLLCKLKKVSLKPLASRAETVSVSWYWENKKLKGSNLKTLETNACKRGLKWDSPSLIKGKLRLNKTSK